MSQSRDLEIQETGSSAGDNERLLNATFLLPFHTMINPLRNSFGSDVEIEADSSFDPEHAAETDESDDIYSSYSDVSSSQDDIGLITEAIVASLEIRCSFAAQQASDMERYKDLLLPGQNRIHTSLLDADGVFYSRRYLYLLKAFIIDFNAKIEAIYLIGSRATAIEYEALKCIHFPYASCEVTTLQDLVNLLEDEVIEKWPAMCREHVIQMEMYELHSMDAIATMELNKITASVRAKVTPDTTDYLGFAHEFPREAAEFNVEPCHWVIDQYTHFFYSMKSKIMLQILVNANPSLNQFLTANRLLYQLIICAGTSRQDGFHDRLGQYVNGSGLFLHDLHDYTDWLAARVEYAVIFDSTLIPDHQYKFDAGAFARFALKMDNPGFRYVFDERKFLILYGFAHQQSLAFPRDLITIQLIDDRHDIIDGLYELFKKNSKLLPANVILEFVKCREDLQCYPPIYGTGLIDAHYPHSIRKITKWMQAEGVDAVSAVNTPEKMAAFFETRELYRVKKERKAAHQSAAAAASPLEVDSSQLLSVGLFSDFGAGNHGVQDLLDRLYSPTAVFKDRRKSL